jgi:hypothetical protein
LWQFRNQLFFDLAAAVVENAVDTKVEFGIVQSQDPIPEQVEEKFAGGVIRFPSRP